jgi:hypothetical protein
MQFLLTEAEYNKLKSQSTDAEVAQIKRMVNIMTTMKERNMSTDNLLLDLMVAMNTGLKTVSGVLDHYEALSKRI